MKNSKTFSMAVVGLSILLGIFLCNNEAISENFPTKQ
jgi:hypothetical protein